MASLIKNFFNSLFKPMNKLIYICPRTLFKIG